MYDEINFNELKDIVCKAIEQFNNKDKFLIEKDLSERCICSAFARCIESCIPDKEEYRDVVVDVEYNRGFEGDESRVKRLRNKKIVVDLIVHKRGYIEGEGFYNLICIEMKKSTNREGCSADKQRLSDMTNCTYGYNYSLGCMIVADMSENVLRVEEEYRLQ